MCVCAHAQSSLSTGRRTEGIIPNCPRGDLVMMEGQRKKEKGMRQAEEKKRKKKEKQRREEKMLKHSPRAGKRKRCRKCTQGVEAGTETPVHLCSQQHYNSQEVEADQVSVDA